MENTRTNLFDQWHFAMVNDSVRNNQFALAIKGQIQKIADKKPESVHVVDLGCGTGILTTIIAKELKSQ
jgi:methylase of polypeptide subunit release factors